mmetsp:Transcript_19814/g.32874  ORF Transcript_19814/g.32874 Transcript_19814/m.32874 type:complete len:226 (-) Transcript_19814:335-1012(-)
MTHQHKSKLSNRAIGNSMKSSALAFVDLPAMAMAHQHQSELSNETSSEDKPSLNASQGYQSSLLSDLGGSEHLREISALYKTLMEGLPPLCPQSLPGGISGENNRQRSFGDVSNIPKSSLDGGLPGISCESNRQRSFGGVSNLPKSSLDRGKLRQTSSNSDIVQDASASWRKALGKTEHHTPAVSILGMEILHLSYQTAPDIGDDSISTGRSFDSLKYYRRRVSI